MDPLKFGGRMFQPTVRMVSDLRHVLYDSKWAETAGNFEVYSFYRNLYLSEGDIETMKAHGVQYDITVIQPNRLGAEFAKTKGHYHPKKPDTAVSYPEIYEVISGEAHYLLQKEEDGCIIDVAMIKAAAGDKVIIPPNYGHITINASRTALKMANWVCSNFSSEYEKIERSGGGAYFMLANGAFVPNMRYKAVPQLRFLRPNMSRIGIEGRELYSFISNPAILRFLTHPEEYSSLFYKILHAKVGRGFLDGQKTNNT